MHQMQKYGGKTILEKTIYGGKPKNPVAYCALHNGSLTVKEMKKKGCLGKQCHHLRKMSSTNTGISGRS